MIGSLAFPTALSMPASHSASPPEPLSSTLMARLRRDADAGDGWLSFARFMEIALYTPMAGYYAGGSRKFGASGDFVTAPEMTPLFAQALAVQVAEIIRRSEARVIEAGGGSGRLAADLLLALDAAGCAPDEYALLEVSPDLAARQKALLQSTLPAGLAKRCRWLSQLPERFSGVVLGNELLDAMPIHLVRWTASGILERGVAVAGDGLLSWQERPALGRLLAAAEAIADRLAPADGYLSEISLAGPAWVRSLGERIERGALLLLDYGFPEHEYYHPQRDGGTLMCHHRHRAHTDPLIHVGQQDITAHVDFSAIADAAHEAGLAIAGYTAQAPFLMNCGILDALATVDASSLDGIRARSAVQKLLSPAEMGELFKVIALTRGLSDGSTATAGSAESLIGFRSGDRRWRL
ncbi:MAG TPA: SAM-dependent methyltransferase [Rhodocyclaceae bacterium]